MRQNQREVGNRVCNSCSNKPINTLASTSGKDEISSLQKRLHISLIQACANMETEIEKTKAIVAKLKRECEEGDMKVTFTKMRNLQKQIDAVSSLVYTVRQEIQ
jgi:hypothetical protein